MTSTEDASFVVNHVITLNEFLCKTLSFGKVGIDESTISL